MKNSNTLNLQKLRPMAMALAMSASVLLAGCKSEDVKMVSEPVIRPVLVEVTSDNGVADLSFNGTVYSSNRADLSFRTSGRIVEMLVKEGDVVEQDQLIARLDSVDAELALTAAKVERDNARSEYQRGKTLFENRQSISKSQFEELTLRFNLAQNRYEEAIRRLEDTHLKVPFSGVVSRTFIDNHVLVQSNEVVLSMHDLNQLEAVIHVPDSLMTRDSEESEVLAQSTVAPYEIFTLTLKKYETEPDAVTGTYAVTFAIHTTEGSRLLPGMNVHVYSNGVQSGSKSIQIPLSAVNPDNMGNQYVWVVDQQNKLHKRIVATGSLNGERVQITSNLKLGEKVVVSGTQSLKEGLEVRPELAEGY
ncbi:efflux RND transporter periplasmic adaptor subunit [Vibrio alfacsensis]|uniref:efflux RND transporter periplasmic adaptor subunit n=1 Tax=Vibrio alfacsensis TaxID=1074311 RepID=UPI002ADD3A01|nr:efflux RND transporter periplasmic adaptor subunit [Vibrio alfacsensis]WQE78361.1 efflux RND transporter periplasmic adaptor subunit [Vibrio alfacsensis]